VGGAVAAATLHEKLVAALLGLLGALANKGEVRSLLLLVLLGTLGLETLTVLLAVDLEWGDQTLDLRGLLVLLATLGGDGAANHELLDVLVLAEVEELADLGGTLGSETHRLGLVGEA